MIKVGYWGIAILFLIGCSQKNIKNSFVPKVEQKVFLQHKSLIYDCFKKYMERADFLDESGFVTDQSIKDFKALFAGNAKVWNDFLWEPRMEYANVYADQVYYYHRVRGLKVSFPEDVIGDLYNANPDDLSVFVDTADPENLTYKYKYRTIKGNFHILNKEHKVLYYQEPIEYELDFVFFVSDREKEALIIDILPVSEIE